MALDVQPAQSSAIPAAAHSFSLQAALIARTYVNVPDPIGTILADFASDNTIWASTGYRSPEMRKLVTQYIEDFDEGDQTSRRHGIVALLQKDLPVIPVSWYEHNAARLAPSSLQLDPFEISYRLPQVQWAA